MAREVVKTLHSVLHKESRDDLCDLHLNTKLQTWIEAKIQSYAPKNVE